MNKAKVVGRKYPVGLGFRFAAVGLLGWLVVLSGCASQQAGEVQQRSEADQPVVGVQHCAKGKRVVPAGKSGCPPRNLVSRTLDRATVKFNPGKLSLPLLEGVAVGAGYKYRVEPSYRDEYFTRIDSYTISRRVNAGDRLGTLPVNIGFSRGASILFAQQFADGLQARSPQATYFPQQLPTTAKNATALRVGDYVRFNTRMALTASASQVWPLAGYFVTGKTGLSVLVAGEYQVHLFRLDKQRIRLKLVAERSNRRSAGVQVALNPLVRAAILQQKTKRLLPLAELAKLDAKLSVAVSKSNSQLFLVDYTLDLAEPAIAAAFDALFNGTRLLTDVDVANPLRGQMQLKNRLIGRLAPLDDLAIEQLETTSPTVVRNFQGANLSRTRGINFDVRISTFDVQRSRTFRDNFLSRNDLQAGGKELRTYYLLPNWAQRRERSMLFGMLDENMLRTADALFVADAAGNPVRFMNIGFGFDYTDRRLRPSEYRSLRRKLELLLPDAAEQQLRQQMSDTRWLQDSYRRNFSLQLNYFFREAAFDALVAQGYGNAERLEQALASFIVRSIENGEFPYYRGNLQRYVESRSAGQAGRGTASLQQQAQKLAARQWAGDIKPIARQLATAFTAGDNTGTRMRAILDLRKRGFYRQVGTAFWADLINQSAINLADVMYLQLRLAANGHQGIELSFGEPGERVLYESAKFIEQVLNNRSVDMREPGALDTIISRMTVVEP